MVAHWGDLLVTGLLAAVSVASVCGQVFTRGILVPPGTQNNSAQVHLIKLMVQFFCYVVIDSMGLASRHTINSSCTLGELLVMI